MAALRSYILRYFFSRGLFKGSRDVCLSRCPVVKRFYTTNLYCLTIAVDDSFSLLAILELRDVYEFSMISFP